MGQVYRHVSPSGKSYIGKTIFTWQSRARKNPAAIYGAKFSRAIEKYGWENFAHEVLEESDDEAFLLERETYWIIHFNSVKNGYNVIGDGTVGTRRSFKEQIAQIADFEDTLLKLYHQELYSLNEIGEAYGFSPRALVAYLAKNKIARMPRNSVGKEARWRAEGSKGTCEICNSTFTKKRRSSKYCSSVCANVNRGVSIKAAVEFNGRAHLMPEANAKRAESLKGNGNAKGNRGGLVTTHKRWHTNKNIFNPNCEICTENV